MLGTEISTPDGTHSGDRVTENTFSAVSDRKELSDSRWPDDCAIRVSAHHPIGHCPVRPDAPTVGRLVGKSTQWRNEESTCPCRWLRAGGRFSGTLRHCCVNATHSPVHCTN